MKLRMNGVLDINYHSNELREYERVIILLHGYSESGEKIYKRLSPYLPLNKHLIIAPDGPFPLVDRFPLEKAPSSEKLLRGYAWYFFDQHNNKYLIDYAIPASFLDNLITELNVLCKPVTLIGYSQGGYLAPFLGAKHTMVEDIIGINCSYRHDLFPKEMDKPIDAFQGADDTIIDVNHANKRHQEYGHGNYRLISGEAHRLSPSLAKVVGDHYLEKHN